jgi:acyl transferase domain-containing protein
MSAPLPWVLSAPDEPGLREQAERLRTHLEAHPSLDPPDVGWSLVSGRAHLPRRAVAVGADRAALLAGLGAIASGDPAPGVARGSAGTAGMVAFVFPGQGSQWPGMALELAAAAPVFARSLKECEAALAPHIEWKLDDVLRAAPDDPLWERSDIVQPSLFCVMVSLAALWRSYGVRPDAVVGHSLGEISAACVAGILSLEDAGRVAALTSRALHELGGDDGMVLVDLGAEPLAQRIEAIGGRLTLAAFNGPHAIVVSGEQPALDALLASCERDGIRPADPRRRHVVGRALEPDRGDPRAPGARPRARDAATQRRDLLLVGDRRAGRLHRARPGLLVPEPAPAGPLPAGHERARARRRDRVRRVQPAPRPDVRRRGVGRGDRPARAGDRVAAP